MMRFGLIGTGSRARAYAQVAQQLPDSLALVGVVSRTAVHAEEFSQQWKVPAYPALAELVRVQRPDYLVLSVPREVSAAQIAVAADLGVPVLCETPPAADLEGMLGLWRLAQEGARIQIAEQYPFQPWHAARIALVDSGVIGPVSMASVSFSHGYHAMSVLRRLLQVGGESVDIQASTVRGTVETGTTRAGDRQVLGIMEDARTIALMNFGDRLGVYDFADNQHRSYVRKSFIQVRGEKGEIVTDRIHLVHGLDESISIGLHRQPEGGPLKGIAAADGWPWRNPYPGARFGDDELALAKCLELMGGYVAGGPAFYGVADAAQDWYLGEAVEQAVKAGGRYRAERQPWADAVLPAPGR